MKTNEERIKALEIGFLAGLNFNRVLLNILKLNPDVKISLSDAGKLSATSYTLNQVENEIKG